MYPDITVIAIPLLLACVVIEYLYDRNQRSTTFRLNGAISNISCGIFEQMTGFISKGIFIALYIFLYENYRQFHIDLNVLTWIVLILLVDLIFYFFHRFEHQCSFLWAAHVVHHEIEELNLTVALRRSVMQEFLIIWVYLPMAIVGFPPGPFFLVFAAQNLYQFTNHTDYLPELRLLGKIFVTPHHHALHHCRNQCYWDKNFGGIFIFWDKLFGTFAARSEQPEFGVQQETKTLNPVKAQITTMIQVLQETKKRGGLIGKMQALFGSPSYLSLDNDDSRFVAASLRVKYDPVIPPRKMRLAFISFAALVVGGAFYLLHFEHLLSIVEKSGITLLFVVVLYCIGTILDNKSSKNTQENDDLFGTQSTFGPR